MIIRPREGLAGDGLPPRDMLASVIREHRAEAARIAGLRAAYNAQNSILGRQRRDGLPNNRIAHPYARYITTIATGYLIGQPVAYASARPSAALQAIQEAFRRGSEPAENVQIARDQSICGKGVEYVHIDRDGLPRATAVRPESAFVVYADDCDMEPLFGVYYLPRVRGDGTPEGFHVWLLTEDRVIQYEAASLDALGAPLRDEPHYFGGVPLVEYWNDDTERGDFEWVLTLIDAYDRLQSDRVNDKEQFVDRLLVLTGAILEADERGRKPMQQLREDHALQLPDAQSKAEYLTSEMNEADVEVLRQSLLQDIHKLSMVPDLSDEHFAANASGVAMRYKLLGFEQIIRVKERWFEEGLRTRLKLFAHYMELRGAEPLDVSEVRISFTHALPVNLLENAEIACRAVDAGAASLGTAVRLLHAGDEWTDDDVEKEIAAIRAGTGGNETD